jgi:hemerythrin superfamily protein
MDATKLLKQQHAEVKELFARFESSQDAEEKQQLFERLADNLAAHSAIEEKVFYPAVYVGELQEKLREAVEEHLAVKRLIADLLDMDPEDSQFDSKMAVLKEGVAHHVKEEEGQIFPKVTGSFSSDELEAMGSEMARMFEELQKSEPRKEVPAETEEAPRLA